jgi:tetratricopeptide (TPR) repeat protein
MPEESAILAYAPDLATGLIVRSLSRDWASFLSSDRPILLKCFRQAEASALASLCEESLWNDFELMPALRDELVGDELAELGHKVLRPDGRAIRAIRDRALSEVARLRKSNVNSEAVDALPQESADVSPAEFQQAATSQYVAALTQWLTPTPVPPSLKKRIIDAWYPRFGAAFRKALSGNERFREVTRVTAAEDRRFDELEKQSWRLDEILGKLDKWVQANPGSVRGASGAGAEYPSGAETRGPEPRWFLMGSVCALLGAALLGTAYWLRFGASPSIEALVAKVQARRVAEVSERIVRASAWMGGEPVPRNVFTVSISALQDAKETTNPITPARVDAALLDLQRKELCRSVADGWIFHEEVRERFRLKDAAGRNWWLRSLELLLAAAPTDEEFPASVNQWRLLLPHLAELFETVPNDLSEEPLMQRLVPALSRGLLASRVEPGRRPTLSPDTQEPEALQKRLSVFAEAANARLEEGLKKIESRYGRFSNEMANAHRLLAELSWRSRELKKEQDSWIRAVRVLEKQEPRDVNSIAFCNLRLGISRSLAGDNDRAEEAFAEVLKVIREQHGQTHPEIGRTERKIARMYTDLGQFQLAWQHHERALEALMKAYPVSTPEIAELHEEQAELLVDYGEYKKGIALLKRGIEIWQEIEYATSPHIAHAQGILANAEMLAGEMAEAERNARGRLDLLQREYGVSARPVRDAENDLAMLLLSTGESSKATEVATLLKSRVAIPLDAKFVDDAETALVRCLYARSLAQTNQMAEAVAHFDRGIRVLMTTQPRPSLVVAGCLRDYGQSLLAVGRKPEGLKALEDAEAELSALSRLRPRYLRIATAQIDEIKEQLSKARQ